MTNKSHSTREQPKETDSRVLPGDFAKSPNFGDVSATSSPVKPPSGPPSSADAYARALHGLYLPDSTYSRSSAQGSDVTPSVITSGSRCVSYGMGGSDSALAGTGGALGCLDWSIYQPLPILAKLATIKQAMVTLLNEGSFAFPGDDMVPLSVLPPDGGAPISAFANVGASFEFSPSTIFAPGQYTVASAETALVYPPLGLSPVTYLSTTDTFLPNPLNALPPYGAYVARALYALFNTSAMYFRITPFPAPGGDQVSQTLGTGELTISLACILTDGLGSPVSNSRAFTMRLLDVTGAGTSGLMFFPQTDGQGLVADSVVSLGFLDPAIGPNVNFNGAPYTPATIENQNNLTLHYALTVSSSQKAWYKLALTPLRLGSQVLRSMQ